MPSTYIYGAGTYESVTVMNESSGSYWMPLSTSMYNERASTTSRILASDTSLIRNGMGVRYTVDRFAGYSNPYQYYGIVTNIEPNTYFDISGYPLKTDRDMYEVAVSYLVHQMDLYVPGTFADNTGNVISTKLNRRQNWVIPDAFLVSLSAKYATGSGSPQINVYNSSQYAFSTNLTVSTSWADTGVTADYPYYFQDEGGISLSVLSTGPGASDLIARLMFVIK